MGLWPERRRYLTTHRGGMSRTNSVYAYGAYGFRIVEPTPGGRNRWGKTRGMQIRGFAVGRLKLRGLACRGCCILLANPHRARASPPTGPHKPTPRLEIERHHVGDRAQADTASAPRRRDDRALRSRRLPERQRRRIELPGGVSRASSIRLGPRSPARQPSSIRRRCSLNRLYEAKSGVMLSARVASNGVGRVCTLFAAGTRVAPTTA